MGGGHGHDGQLPAAAGRRPGEIPADEAADPGSGTDQLLNPGAAWVSQLSAEPEVFREVLDDMLAPAQATGLLRCLMRHRPMQAEMAGDRVVAVSFEDLQTGDRSAVVAAYVLGRHRRRRSAAADRLRVGHRCGSDHGYRRAARIGGAADPLDQQAITWCAALEWRPGEDNTIDRPDGYQFWRSYQDAFWPGPQLGGRRKSQRRAGRSADRSSRLRVSRTCGRFVASGTAAITRRRLRCDAGELAPGGLLAHAAPRSGRSRRVASLAKARELSVCFLYWLQTMHRDRTAAPDIPSCGCAPTFSAPRWSGCGGVHSREPPDRRRIHRAGNPRRSRGSPWRRSG